MQTLDVELCAINKTRSQSKSTTATILNNVTLFRNFQFAVHEGGAAISEAASGSLAYQVFMLLTKKGTFTIIIFSIVTITTNMIVIITLIELNLITGLLRKIFTRTSL